MISRLSRCGRIRDDRPARQGDFYHRCQPRHRTLRSPCAAHATAPGWSSPARRWRRTPSCRAPSTAWRKRRWLPAGRRWRCSWMCATRQRLLRRWNSGSPFRRHRRAGQQRQCHQLTPTLQTPARRLDLMWDVNMRATFLASQACIPHLKNAVNPHVLTLSPPLNLDPKWFSPHVAYTLSKYGMSLCTMGMAHEFAAGGIAFNCLWPRTNHRHRRHRIQFSRSHPARFTQAIHRGRCGACHSAARQRDMQRQLFYRRRSVARNGRERFRAICRRSNRSTFKDLFLD